MSRINILFLIGALVAALGTFLSVSARALATHWSNGVGYADPQLRQTYTIIGLIVLCFGLAMIGLGAWKWTVRDRDRLARR